MGTPTESTNMSQGVIDVDADWRALIKSKKDLEQAVKVADLSITETINTLAHYISTKEKLQSDDDIDYGKVLILISVLDRIVQDH